jgi:hypothetical protein
MGLYRVTMLILNSETLAFLGKNGLYLCEPGLDYAAVRDGTTTKPGYINL